MTGVAARERRDAQRQVVARRHQRAAVGREGDAVDVLLMALDHLRRAAAERPHPRGAIPRCRGEQLAVRRHGERHDRTLVTFEHRRRLRLAGLPDRDARILAAGRHASVGQERDRVHRAVVEAQHLLGGVALQRPADRRGVEAAGNRLRAVGRDRERPHRPAVPAQLGVGSARRKQQSACKNSNDRHEARRFRLPSPREAVGRGRGWGATLCNSSTPHPDALRASTLPTASRGEGKLWRDLRSHFTQR